MQITSRWFEISPRQICSRQPYRFQLSKPSFRSAVLAEARIRSGVAWWVVYFPSASGGLPPRLLSPFEGGWVNCPAPEAPLTRGIPTGPRAFLGTPGACGLRPCSRSNLKEGLVPYLPVRWGGQQIPPLYKPSFRLAVLVEARIRLGVAWWLDYFPSASGGLPPRLSLPSGRLGSSPGAWVAPNKGNAEGAVGIFGNSGRVWATALRPVPPKKRPCAILARKVGRSTNTSTLQARHVRVRFECPGTLPSHRLEFKTFPCMTLIISENLVKIPPKKRALRWTNQRTFYEL